MSEEWKNSRMEADIRQHEAEMLQAAAERLKKQTITGEWKINITAKGAKASEIINEFVTALMKLEKEFTGDDVTTEVDPITKQTKNDD
jgi:hypothetical protein